MRVHGTVGWGMGNLARVKSSSCSKFKMSSNKEVTIKIKIQGEGFDCRTNKTGGDGEWSNVAVQVIS